MATSTSAVTFVNDLDYPVKITIDIPMRSDRSFTLAANGKMAIKLATIKKWNGIKVKVNVPRARDISAKFYQQIEPRKSKMARMQYSIQEGLGGIVLVTTTICQPL